MKVLDESIFVPPEDQLRNIYRVRKANTREEDKTRVVEVHTIDLSRPVTVNAACEFENGWHVLGYVSSLTYKDKVWELISEFERKSLKRVKERMKDGTFAKVHERTNMVAEKPTKDTNTRSAE